MKRKSMCLVVGLFFTVLFFIGEVQAEVELHWDYADPSEVHGYTVHWGDESKAACIEISEDCEYQKTVDIEDPAAVSFVLENNSFAGMMGSVYFRLTAYNETEVGGEIVRRESEYCAEEPSQLIIRILRPTKPTNFTSTSGTVVIFE